ncbi:helix-turn-helix domain-containing protein [Bremerella sp. T1]|uniref:helix-turn-helix domain-containing protein n=1 Tax=Bremerella sp. TYQ1 TaxID=3119568 RepID=UPI001CCBE1E4|nr:helix-turn-helix domain-containing protein [Bremerella volcania]
MPKTIDPPNNDPLLISATKAAELLSVSPRTLWALTNEGEIPFVRIRRRVMYSRTALRKWINARMTGRNSDSH